MPSPSSKAEELTRPSDGVPMLTYVIPVLAIVLLGAALRRMRRVPEGLFPARA